MNKRNVRVIPASVRSKLDRLRGKNVIAACSRVYSAQDLAHGQLKHLNIVLADGRLSLPESVLPPPNRGKYSKRNVEGTEIIRTDLPKETHYNTIESPNWGDSSYGTHPVNLPYEKYPRDLVAPALSRLTIRSPNAEDGLSSYALIFEVQRVLDPQAKNFEDSLIECLNLLQENVGCCDVQASDATLDDYLRSLRVSWEVLPPGTREDAVARLFRGRTPSAQEVVAVEERYDFLMSLHPEKLVYGTSGLERYFGGMIREDLIVFENVEYGNAIYIMYENWRELSQRTRTELQSGRFGRNFDRVVHGKRWKTEVKRIIKDRSTAK